MTEPRGDGWYPCPCCDGSGGSNAGPLPVHVTVEAAAQGVDTDCGSCANGGIERLMEAGPGIDWVRAVHDAQKHEEDYAHYWCGSCPEGVES